MALARWWRGQDLGECQRTSGHGKEDLMGGLTLLAVVVVAYTLVASELGRWRITGPMVFAAAGAILGPGGLDVLPLSLTSESVLIITELTLALLLFSDASTVRLRDVEGRALRSHRPRRLD
jgi:sodium/hydrogen antiporter